MPLLSWIGSWLTGPYDSSNEQKPRIRDGQFVPTLADIRRARDLLRFKVPTELADIILDMAEYHHVLTLTMNRPRNIFNSVHHADVPVLSLYLSRPEYSDFLDCVLRVSLVIKGHDQGWSGYPDDKGTDRNSWTWYSIGTDDPRTHEQRLVTNLHAVEETQTHVFEWDRDSTIVQWLKEGKKVEVWAHARYPGWQNHVEYAELSVACFPL